MPRRASLAATPQMNMTPLIDVVFQLIIFFMLVNNIVGEQSVPMIVPTLDESKTRPLDEELRVVVNVVPMDHAPADRAADPLDFPGRAIGVQVGQRVFAADDLAGITAELRGWRRKHPQVQVLLRADAALHYEAVAPVMTAVAAAQVRAVNLVAYMPEPR